MFLNVKKILTEYCNKRFSSSAVNNKAENKLDELYIYLVPRIVNNYDSNAVQQ